MLRFCINFSKHGDHYNFSDSQGPVSDFLMVFENVFIPQPNLSRVRFKCSFTIINHQPAPRVGFVEGTDSRVWQINVYEGVYFNEYVKANLTQDILKCVIINGMSGSSWRCKSFDVLSLTATSLKILLLVFDVKSSNLFKSMLKLMEMMIQRTKCQMQVVMG